MIAATMMPGDHDSDYGSDSCDSGSDGASRL